MENVINKTAMGDEIRAMMNLRCGDMEESNKYCMSLEEKICIFCATHQDSIMDHYIDEFVEAKEWFEKLGNTRDEMNDKIWKDELTEKNEKILKKLWWERDKRRKKRKRERSARVNQMNENRIQEG